MMRYLAYTSPARGHLYPIVPTLEALKARGHQVFVRTLAAEVPRMARLGFAAAAIDSEIEGIEHDDFAARSPIAANKRVMATFAKRARHELADLTRAIEESRPHVVLVDINCWGAAPAAESSGLPWAHWTPYFTPLPSKQAPPFGLGLRPARGPLGRLRDVALREVALAPVRRAKLGEINDVRRSVGARELRHLDDLWLTAPLHLYLTAEPFEYARSDWPDSFRLIGPCNWEPPAEEPDWLAKLDGPLVLVTCSTEFQDDSRLIASALEALADADVFVVATTAAIDPEGFSAPDNARVERFVAHGPVLRRAVCVVCHGGMGITQKALAAGVPVCIVPFGRDQLEVAGHVVEAGAGTRLAPRRLSASRLREAVDQAIALQPGARRIADAFARAGGPAAAADALESLAARADAAAGTTP
jgi:MGT family glycosyltransferase